MLLGWILLSSVSSAEPSLMVTNYSLTPEVLLPGDEALLTVTITNTETTGSESTTSTFGNSQTTTTELNAATIENIWMTADGDGEYLVSARNNFPDLGNLASGTSITIDFAISAHDNISEGLYFPTIHIDVEDYQDVQFPIPVRVSQLSAYLLAKEIPSKISSSGSTKIQFTAVNRRESAIEDVTISASNESSFEVSPQTLYIGSLASESSQDCSFALNPKKLGEQTIPFTISYRNGENVHSDTIILSIEVVETADVSPVLYDFPTMLAQGSSERITLEVFNAKTESINGVIVVPVTNLTVTPSEYFIGSMDPDDVFSASFDIQTDTSPLGNYSIGFKVAFKQNNNYFESPSTSRIIQVVKAGPAQQGDATVLYAGVIVVILLIVVGFYIMRRRRKEK
jgi:hypothetical protein